MQKVRCGGSLCGLCERGWSPELYFVLGGLVQGQRRLLELRERHRPILEELDAHPGGGVGHTLDVAKVGPARNAPVGVEIRAYKAGLQEWDIAALVGSLGLAPVPPTLPLLENPEAEPNMAALGRSDQT